MTILPAMPVLTEAALDRKVCTEENSEIGEIRQLQQSMQG